MAQDTQTDIGSTTGASSAESAMLTDGLGWQPIETAPRGGRELILLKTPHAPDGCIAYSNTWWIAGFSVECKPTHWKPSNVK